MTVRIRRAVSRAAGWLSDRRIPGPLRSFVYRGYGLVTGADTGEAELELSSYPSLGAFFVRRLRPGARPVAGGSNLLVSPCDGTFQAVDRIHGESLIQAKAMPYSVPELLSGADAGIELEGGCAWTIYLSPRDYHRVHVPLAGELSDVRWVPGDRLSVAPSVLSARRGVFVRNERVVLRLESPRGPYFLVMVGALNVGRIRVVGVAPGTAPQGRRCFERGEELARFEMGSTVVLLFPGPLPPRATPNVAPGEAVRLGQAIGVV